MTLPLEVHSGCSAIKSLLAAMKSALMSTAEMWRGEWDVIVGFLRDMVVSTRGPLALSRMRRGEGGGGRCGVVRERRWVARWMLQLPVREL